MASVIHAASFPPPAFHRTDVSMNGIHYSHGHMHSFDGNQSIGSTPAVTPPPRAPSHTNYTANMVNAVRQAPGYGGYQNMNGYPQQMQYPQNPSPQIYTAVYSSVQVYEMEVNGVAVMRRRADSWLNATQILKVAGVEKGKRTKVLEKEILNGEHEKVQGGYGKYQGTWISYDRGVEFCRQYGVEAALLPLLQYDLSNDGGQAGLIDTPTKEQAMAANRKRNYSGQDNRPMSRTSNGTFFQNMSSHAANAISALSKTRIDSPGPRGMDMRRSMGPRRPTNQFDASQESTFPSGSQQSMHSIASDSSFGGPVQNPAPYPYASNFADFPENSDMREPPRKRIRPSQSNSFMASVDPGLDNSMAMGSPTEPNASFFSQAPDSQYLPVDGLSTGLPPLPMARTPAEEQKKELLIDLFIDPNRTDFSDHPAFLSLSGEDLEIPIDGSSNTALHWAATLARISLVKLLISKGFDIRRTNGGGETALIAACGACNNLDQSSFPELLELLGGTIEVKDSRGRTILHHIAVSSAIRGRGKVGRYYLESLLEFVVQKGGVSNSQTSGSSNGQHLPRINITLGRFMSDIVNAKDKAGDTALNLAARTSTRSIIDQLIEVGADATIKNNGGLAPVDFGVGSDAPARHIEQPQSQTDSLMNGNMSTQTSFADTQSEIMSSIRDIFAASEVDFAQELHEKQGILDELNIKLKEVGAALAGEKRQLEGVKKRTTEKAELEQKLTNLQRSCNEIRQQVSKNGKKLSVDTVPIGEADKGLDLNGNLSRVGQLFPDGLNLDLPLSDEQVGFLSSLERAEVLSGRVKAYQQHNDELENRTKHLKSRSTELEDRYRKIVGLCTGVEEGKVDEMLGTLLQAVVSEQSEVNDITRIREFMRMVEGAES